MSLEHAAMNDHAASESPGGERSPPLPPVPRPVSARARRRSWSEMPVRAWMIVAAAAAIVMVYFVVTRTREAFNDRWLVQNGKEITAKLVLVNGDPYAKRQPRNEPMLVRISFDWNGKEVTPPDQWLDARPEAYLMPTTTIQIMVDPNDSNHWIEKTEPKPWIQELTAVGVLLPIFVIVLAMMLWKRRGVLKVWQNGALFEAVVVDARQTAMAPMSRIVRFCLRAGEDRRIWSTLMPTTAGIPAQGQTLWLICPPNNPGRAIVAKLYQEG